MNAALIVHYGVMGRYRWGLTDARISLLRNSVTNLLVLQTILDYVVSKLKVFQVVSFVAYVKI